MRWRVAVMLIPLTLGQSKIACSHALDPAYLELASLDQVRWRVTWRVPDIGGRPMSLDLLLPKACDTESTPAQRYDGRGWSAVFVLNCPHGLIGRTVEINGLQSSRTDALVRLEMARGQSTTARLTSERPTYTIPVQPNRLQVFISYVSLGVTHILEGADHLLFVLALLLLVKDPKRLIWAVSAFTLAHSITLVAATKGWLKLPAAPVEVVIAISIVFLACELAKPREHRDQLAERFPAIVSFGFGLIHGLGFAGALREIGLPQQDVPLALFSFNLGVEFGQLLFVAAAMGLFGFLRWRMRPSPQLRPLLDRAAGYVIGPVAAFWAIQRLAGF